MCLQASHPPSLKPQLPAGLLGSLYKTYMKVHSGKSHSYFLSFLPHPRQGTELEGVAGLLEQCSLYCTPNSSFLFLSGLTISSYSLAVFRFCSCSFTCLSSTCECWSPPPPETLGGFPDLTFSLDPQMTYKEARSLFSSFRSSGGSEIC